MLPSLATRVGAVMVAAIPDNALRLVFSDLIRVCFHAILVSVHELALIIVELEIA